MKEHKLTSGIYDAQGEMDVHQQVMDSYSHGTLEQRHQDEMDQQYEKTKK
ncbi:hypothetical protein [Bacillus suaedae]|uniref:DUF4025 domain-containing protein n=1 Tax=Halalkalibacter suaedae TaxID=2822140 RepID=A0A940WX31_9BACI|nr:hypothetical protein [Bacillus suaedae]MBP3949761.1 hypothetical protein [Bacillus suaedae]